MPAVQRILRLTDPRMTTETYGHLVPDYLRSQIDRFSFGPMVGSVTGGPAGPSSAPVPIVSSAEQSLAKIPLG